MCEIYTIIKQNSNKEPGFSINQAFWFNGLLFVAFHEYLMMNSHDTNENDKDLSA